MATDKTRRELKEALSELSTEVDKVAPSEDSKEWFEALITAFLARISCAEQQLLWYIVGEETVLGKVDLPTVETDDEGNVSMEAISELVPTVIGHRWRAIWAELEKEIHDKGLPLFAADNPSPSCESSDAKEWNNLSLDYGNRLSKQTRTKAMLVDGYEKTKRDDDAWNQGYVDGPLIAMMELLDKQFPPTKEIPYISHDLEDK